MGDERRAGPVSGGLQFGAPADGQLVIGRFGLGRVAGAGRVVDDEDAEFGGGRRTQADVVDDFVVVAAGGLGEHAVARTADVERIRIDAVAPARVALVHEGEASRNTDGRIKRGHSTAPKSSHGCGCMITLLPKKSM